MNREILLEASIALTVGLLIAVLAAYRSKNEPRGGAWARSSMSALLVYAVIAAVVIVGQGMTWVGLVILLAVIALPLLANVRAAEVNGPVQRLVAAAAGVGLAAAMLIAAGQTLALLSRVDPRTVVVVIVAIAALLVGGQGLAAAGRIGSTTMWFLLVPIVLSLALGVFVGAPGQAVSPIVAVPSLDWWALLGLVVALIALGWADNGLRSLRRTTRPVVTWAGAAVVVALIALGQLMFLGGAVISPSLQFFVFPANIDIVPGLAGFLLAILTVLFTSLVVTPLAAIGGQNYRWLAGGAALAAVVALFNPGLNTVVVVASLLGAVVLGAQAGGEDAEKGARVGLIAAVVVALALFLLGQADFGVVSALGTVLVAGVAFAAARQGVRETV